MGTFPLPARPLVRSLAIILLTLFILFIQQKEDKIRILRQRLIEREGATKTSTGNVAQTSNEIQLTAANVAQGKDALIVIQAEATTTSDFDSAIGGGLSIITRASQSDADFSESYS